jgi:hypothetical protein
MCPITIKISTSELGISYSTLQKTVKKDFELRTLKLLQNSEITTRDCIHMRLPTK